MDRWERSPEADVARALRGLRGWGTLGDVALATGLSFERAERALERLMAKGLVHVAVCESAVVTYRLDDCCEDAKMPATRSVRWPKWMRQSASEATPSRGFDLKTLRLIRARGGVVSLAEVVEHTGLTVDAAETEAARLSRLYGGEAHLSLDGHTVYAFPDLVESVHGSFPLREPRPAWVRAHDPMRPVRVSGRRATGLITTSVLPWLALTTVSANPIAIAIAAAVSFAGILSLGPSLVRAVRQSPAGRFRDQATIRRYALGHIFETALKGKGVVSLERTRAYLQMRAGGRRVRRPIVLKALKGLAKEFDATVIEMNGDLFFGFRNVKRQFLASHIERERLQLSRRAAGKTLFDSGDSRIAAAERDLASFDRALGVAPM